MHDCRQLAKMRSGISSQKESAFTLIEVLVAMTIFGILTILAYQTLSQSLSNTELLNDRMARIQSIQQTMRLLGRDLMQAAPRPVRDTLGYSYLPALRTSLGTEFALEVTRGGWPNPAGLPRGTLQRAAYRVEDGTLVRYHWQVLDPTLNDEAIATILLDDVDGLLFRYLQLDDEWTEQWPPFGVGGDASMRLRPRAVEVVLTLVDQGEIRRYFEIAP